jgi:hypothetical protein
VIEQEWQALRGEDVDGGDDQRDEEVEGRPRIAVPAPASRARGPRSPLDTHWKTR